MPTLTLTDDQLDIVMAATECYVEGMDEATDNVIDDPSLDSFEEMLDAVDAMHADCSRGIEALVILHAAQRGTIRDLRGRASAI